MVICLERGADLHVAQLMPLPLTVSCYSKIQIGFTFLVPAYPGSPRQRAVKWVRECWQIQKHKMKGLMAQSESARLWLLLSQYFRLGDLVFTAGLHV